MYFLDKSHSRDINAIESLFMDKTPGSSPVVIEDNAALRTAIHRQAAKLGRKVKIIASPSTPGGATVIF